MQMQSCHQDDLESVPHVLNVTRVKCHLCKTFTSNIYSALI